MKIVVYNTSGQYALSRADIEVLVSVLPKDRWAQIDELHLAHSHDRQAEPFEYDARKRIGYLIVPVERKDCQEFISDWLPRCEGALAPATVIPGR